MLITIEPSCDRVGVKICKQSTLDYPPSWGSEKLLADNREWRIIERDDESRAIVVLKSFLLVSDADSESGG